ncbi:MAG: type III pantothenate kinase [Pyrinomonadaceae bacterium]|nr:type III pantothenate kinase [Pyrinomonadaceae bacterium]
MILAIDIGNTTTKFGVFENESLIQRHTIPTIRSKTADDIFESLNGELNQFFAAVIISSVVPELNESFTKLAENHFNSNAVFVTHSFDFGFKINYNPPESVGIDRLIAAYGAVQKYGKPCIVCDFGTATNIEVVNSNNEYIGGIITAGMNLLADSLHARTSKLPKIELRKPEKVIGNSTVLAIQSGVYYGYIGLVDGIVKRMIDELGEKPKIIGTGGLVNLIAETSKTVKIVDENLMLESLSMIYKKML